MYLHKGTSGNPFTNGTAYTKFRKCTSELETQLMRCRRKMPHKSFDTAGHVKWSGTVDEEGRKQHGLHDDLAVTFCLCIYWANQITNIGYPTVNYSALGIPSPL